MSTEPVDFDREAEAQLAEEQGKRSVKPYRSAKVRAGALGDEWVVDDEESE